MLAEIKADLEKQARLHVSLFDLFLYIDFSVIILMSELKPIDHGNIARKSRVVQVNSGCT